MVPLYGLDWSNADLIIPDLRLCQTGPILLGTFNDVYDPVLEGVSNAAPWRTMDRALTIMFELSDTARKLNLSTYVTL